MPERTTGQTVITVVHSPACHFCEDTQQALADLAARYPLTVELVEAAEGRGEALVAEHRAPLLALVLVDGGFFGSGRLPRKKLARLLDRRESHAVA